jgi:tRNA threonylcarbamoyladenosine biosynthesis protein TsaE
MCTATRHAPDEAALRALGGELAARLRPGDLITLSGPLGAGKTTFVQGLAGVLLGPGATVTSPTYVLLNEYPGAIPLLHLDAYRLEDADEEMLRDAGIDEMLLRLDAVKVVEWPEMIEPWLPPARYALTFAHDAGGGRLVTIEEKL